MKNTIQSTRAAAEQLIVAVAASLKEAVDTGDKRAYRTMQKFLPTLGNFAVEVDEIAETVK